MQATTQLKEFYANTFVQNPLLLRRLAEYYEGFVYNINPRLYPDFHETSLEKADIYNFMMLCPKLGLHEEYFLKHLGITTHKNEDFSKPSSRIALLPKQVLAHLVFMAGMSLCREDIIKIVSRNEVQKIKDLENIIPLCAQSKHASAYAFCLQKSNMYKGHCEHVLLQAREDACTKDFKALALHERVLAWGLWSVFSCAQVGGQNLLLRTLVILDDLCAHMPNLHIFSKHLQGLPSYNSQVFAPNSAKDLGTKVDIAWPLLRVLLFKEISCPWEEGWTRFFA